MRTSGGGSAPLRMWRRVVAGWLRVLADELAPELDMFTGAPELGELFEDDE